MPGEEPRKLISLPVDYPIWERVFSVAPLVIVGSKEASGEYNLAPKRPDIGMRIYTNLASDWAKNSDVRRSLRDGSNVGEIRISILQGF